MSRRKRQLTPEERKLWQAVQETTTPLSMAQHGAQTSELALSRPKKKPIGVDLSPLTVSLPKKATGSTTSNLSPDLQTSLKQAPVQMDKRAHRKISRGKQKPEARIDLHGMTLAQAHPTLDAFIRRAYSEEKRLVLVITGKGKSKDDGGPIPTRTGVLRHNVPQWLNQANLAPLILQVMPASQNYGGSGAYFVYLKRRR